MAQISSRSALNTALQQSTTKADGYHSLTGSLSSTCSSFDHPRTTSDSLHGGHTSSDALNNGQLSNAHPGMPQSAYNPSTEPSLLQPLNTGSFRTLHWGHANRSNLMPVDEDGNFVFPNYLSSAAQHLMLPVGTSVPVPDSSKIPGLLYEYDEASPTSSFSNSDFPPSPVDVKDSAPAVDNTFHPLLAMPAHTHGSIYDLSIPCGTNMASFDGLQPTFKVSESSFNSPSSEQDYCTQSTTFYNNTPFAKAAAEGVNPAAVCRPAYGYKFVPATTVDNFNKLHEDDIATDTAAGTTFQPCSCLECSSLNTGSFSSTDSYHTAVAALPNDDTSDIGDDNHIGDPLQGIPVSATTRSVLISNQAPDPPNISRLTPAQRRARDQSLLELRHQGLSYKQIKRYGGFTEAESTLRGRIRTITKPKEQRVRQPKWYANDIELLRAAVSLHSSGHYTHATRTGAARLRQRRLGGAETFVEGKIPWQKVADWMRAEGASYPFASKTCAKKWEEIRL